MILTIAAAVFVFGLLVLVHEFGHFITAKMTGMRVDEFAIGFGPKIISKNMARPFTHCGRYLWAASTI